MPRAIQISLTFDLLREVLTTRRSVALVMKIWTLERTCFCRVLCPITEAEILNLQPMPRAT
jgi:hypothetical protein